MFYVNRIVFYILDRKCWLKISKVLRMLNTPFKPRLNLLVSNKILILRFSICKFCCTAAAIIEKSFLVFL